MSDGSNSLQRCEEVSDTASAGASSCGFTSL